MSDFEKQERREELVEEFKNKMANFLADFIEGELVDIKEGIKETIQEQADSTLTEIVDFEIKKYLKEKQFELKMKKLVEEILTKEVANKYIEMAYFRIRENFKDYSETYIKTTISREVESYFKKMVKGERE